MRRLSFTIWGVMLICLSLLAKPELHRKHSGQALSQADETRFYTYFYEGLRLKESARYDDALQSFRMCLAIDSLNGGALAEAGMLYSMTDQTALAVHSLALAVKADPQNWWYNVHLISLYSELNDLKMAIKTAENLEKYYPYKEEVYSMLSTLYKQHKDYKKAIEALEKLENVGGVDQAVSFEKFQLYVLLKKPQKGIAEIDKLVAKYPSDSRYKVLRGEIYMQQNQPDKAYSIYQEVLAEDPKYALAYVSLSDYYNAVNQPEKAMESIVQALKSDDLEVDTKVQVLGQYVDKFVRDSTRFAQTESLFKMLVDRYPLEEQVHSYYALFLQYQNRKAELISELETILNINDKNDQAWLQLIQIYAADRNYMKALELSNKALVILPENAALYYFKGMSYFQINNFVESQEAYQKGLEYLTADQKSLKSDFYAQIGDCYFKQEKMDSAFVNYDRSIEANPQNMMVMNNYAYYLSLEKKDLKKAERMSAKTVELDPKNSTFLDTYAWILYQQGSYSLARFYIERAMDNLQTEEDKGVILEHYGDILWMSKNEDKAMEMWQKSYESGNKTDSLKQKIDQKGMSQ